MLLDQHFPLQKPPKFTQIAIHGLKISGNPTLLPLLRQQLPVRLAAAPSCTTAGALRCWTRSTPTRESAFQSAVNTLFACSFDVMATVTRRRVCEKIAENVTQQFFCQNYT
jgi:hypothetical protein